MSSARLLLAISLLWLAGAALRLTILAVPPVIPLIHDDLHMSETEVGILSGLPPLLFAIAAVPGSLLIARLGAVPALVTGMLITGIASALRGAVHDVGFLFAMTFLMSFGVAVMQPAMPPIVRQWLPDRISFGTAVYTNGLLFGEIFPAALTIPWVLPAVGQSWPAAFVVWSIPVLLIAFLFLLARPDRNRPREAAPNRRWWPDWRQRAIWRIGLVLGCANSIYFGVNGFLPDYLTSLGRADLINAALTSLNAVQLPASFLLLAFAGRLERKLWPFWSVGLLTIASVFALMFGSAEWVVVAAGLLGFAAAWILILALALPPLLSEPGDVHRVSAGMFSISYSVAVLVPVLSGLLWDLTGVPATAFIPVGICGALITILSPGIQFPRRTGEA